MIEVKCGCATLRKLPESAAGRRLVCSKCSQQIDLVCAETLADGAGVGDFDAQLTILSGPENVGTRLVLGGVEDLSIGKLPDRAIPLLGSLVSREHCRLVRVNFGPSVWKIVDNKSTNGLFVNGQRITQAELADGDTIRVGNYELKYDHVETAYAIAEPAPIAVTVPTGSDAAAVTAARAAGSVCPCCEKSLAANAKICVQCGIKLPSGRPLLTSNDVDLNSLHENTRKWIAVASYLLPLTPLPLPIRSEAFGTRKPYAIWTIAVATILASITFYIAQLGADHNSHDSPGINLMLWPDSGASADASGIKPEMIQRLLEKEDASGRALMHVAANDQDHRLTDEEAAAVVLQRVMDDHPHGEFHWYQLLTCAFLHDTSSPFNFIRHLGGNLLFMLVFGPRVNALIGNLATAILYPILAICSAGFYLLTMPAGPPHPLLGASGAIMGLAGVYLVLFPIHRVFCVMWISIGLWIRRYFAFKIFTLRGFWILLIYFAQDIVMNAIDRSLSHGNGSGGGVAHMAHIGGFSAGVVLGLGVLLSRLFNTHGGDLLSVTLGRYAWPLIGKPNQWSSAVTTSPTAIPLLARLQQAWGKLSSSQPPGQPPLTRT